MSEIDPSIVRPMEPHLLKICEEVIKLKYDESTTNTRHLQNLCDCLLEKMKENSQVFEKLFESRQPAGSYPENIKISEPNEYDELIVLQFPSARVMASRPGYATINIKDSIQSGKSNIDKVNYNLFVDDEGYLIQNKVLNWLRDVVRSTLVECNNEINTDKDTYEIDQSSNGPAVTLNVTVRHHDIQFSVDLVGCLAFHSDECWLSDVVRLPCVWNAIPKPIKLNENVKLQSLDAVLNNINNMLDTRSKEKEKMQTRKAVNGKSIKDTTVSKMEKVKRPPSCFWYKKRKSKVSKNAEMMAVDFININKRNENTRTVTGYRKPKIVNVDEKMLVDVKSKKAFVEENVITSKICNIMWEKSTVVKGKTTEARFQNRSSLNRRPNNVPDGPATKRKMRNDLNKEKKSSNFIPNPSKNREWICSYAGIERQFLKGTQNMKPLIRIFKKIRDNKQLTNLKSYYIKTIFLHQNSEKGSEYWQQSLAILFMEMFDVILKHLLEHRLQSFWIGNLICFIAIDQDKLLPFITVC